MERMVNPIACVKQAQNLLDHGNEQKRNLGATLKLQCDRNMYRMVCVAGMAGLESPRLDKMRNGVNKNLQSADDCRL
jgi:hypothetical protein